MGLDFLITAKIEYISKKTGDLNTMESDVCYWRKDYGIRDRLVNEYGKGLDDVIIDVPIENIPDLIEEIWDYANNVDNIDSVFCKEYESAYCISQIPALVELKYAFERLKKNDCNIEFNYLDFDAEELEDVDKIKNLEVTLVNSY